MIETDAPTRHLLSKSRASAIQGLALSAGSFVLLLLFTSPLRDEPSVVVWSYLGLLGVFALSLRLRKTSSSWAGALVCLGPFVLVTVLVSVRGGVTNPPAMLAYLTLVVLAALCWGAQGAYVLGTLGSLAVACFAALGPKLAGMGPIQTWAEISFQLAAVAFVSHVLLRAVERSAEQALRLEAEEHKANLARAALEARVLESRSLEAVGRLAGGVAHDFNNLLTVILSGSECSLRNPRIDPSTREDILRIEDAAVRAAKLTQQLLAVGRKQVLSPIVLCPARTVRELEPLIRRLLPATTSLIFELDAATGNAKVDESRLEQIVLNLVTNANDAVGDGGTIRLATTNTSIRASDGPRAGDVPDGDFVELSVTDTGAGMDPEVARRIFEPFFTTKQKGLGTGLGLATVLGIVQQSGGFVDVASEPGKGTRISVFFPRCEKPETELLARAVSPLTGRAHILLVEDEEMVRSATRRLLESLGHTVTDARSGQEALDAMERSDAPFEILISDVIMPGLTGPTLAERLWQKKPDLKVLFISGYPADNLPLSGGLPSQSRYLSKPFGRAELGAMISAMLEPTLSA